MKRFHKEARRMPWPSSDQREIQERRKQPPAGDDARERLLAELPVTERRVQLHGVSTALLEGGDGPPVVLLHGPGGHAASWLRVMPNLVNAYRVIAPDLPGQGASEVLDGPFDADRTLRVARRSDRMHLHDAARFGRARARRRYRGPLCQRAQRATQRAGARGHARLGSVPAGARLRTGAERIHRGTDRRHARPSVESLRLRPRHDAQPDG